MILRVNEIRHFIRNDPNDMNENANKNILIAHVFSRHNGRLRTALRLITLANKNANIESRLKEFQRLSSFSVSLSLTISQSISARKRIFSMESSGYRCWIQSELVEQNGWIQKQAERSLCTEAAVGL